ncbi:MAG: hypothetical protein HQK49_16095 [Oligoflexia bacterium]|nr:hypothetical protein [Oligoflexia bacterium]
MAGMIIRLFKNRNCKPMHVLFFTNAILIIVLSLISIITITSMTITSSYAGLFVDSQRTRLFKIIAKGDDIDNKFESILKTILDIKNEKGVFRINQLKSSIRNSWDNKTLLSYAVEMNRPKIVQMLLNNGADPDIVLEIKHVQYLPIDLAIVACDYDMLKILIKYAKVTNYSSIYNSSNRVHVISKANRCGQQFSDLFIEKYSENSIEKIKESSLVSRIGPNLFDRFIEKLRDKNKITSIEDFFTLFFATPMSNSSSKYDLSQKIIDYFYSFKPTPTQMIKFISLVSPSQKDMIIDQVIQQNPTLKQVMELISISADQKQRDEIRNRALNLNGGIILKQGNFVQNFLSLYEGAREIKLDDATITQFLSSKNPSPTIEEVLAFTSVVKPEQRIDIKRMAYNKYNLVKNPHDFVTLFLNGQEIVNTPANENEQAYEDIIFESITNWFFDFKPLPTIEEVSALAKLVKTDKQKSLIYGLALKNNIPNTPKDILALFRNEGKDKFEFTNFFKDYFLKLKLSFIGNEINEFKNIIAKTDHPKLMETIIKLNQDLVLEHLKDQVKEDISANEADVLNGNCVNESSNGKIRYSLLGFAKNLKKKLEVKNQAEEMECPMCLCDNPVNSFHTCSNPKCQQGAYHGSRCMNCQKQSIDVRLKDNMYPLACNICGEEIALSDEDYELLGLSQQKLDIIKRTILAYHLKRFPDSKNCHTPNCTNKILKKECDKDMHYSCDFCGNSSCFECGENHESNCKNYKVQKDNEKLRQSGLMDCPYCLAWSERVGGCAYVQCANCKQYFNFRTGGPWDDKSANNLHNWHREERSVKPIIKDLKLIYDRNLKNDWDKKENL